MTNSEAPKAKVLPVVEYLGKAIYKSTLVADLNGNPFLLKDRLIWMKNPVYFNNVEEYLSAANSTTIAFLRLGSDFGVLCMQSPTLEIISVVKAVRKRNCGCVQVGRPTTVSGSAKMLVLGSWAEYKK